MLVLDTGCDSPESETCGYEDAMYREHTIYPLQRQADLTPQPLLVPDFLGQRQDAAAWLFEGDLLGLRRSPRETIYVQ
jgi:hypothetical protein